MKITIDFDGELSVAISEQDGMFLISVTGAAESYGDLIFPETQMSDLSEFVTRSGLVRLTRDQKMVVGAVLYAFVNPDAVGE